MPTSRNSSNAAALEEIIALLTDDHQRVKKAFRDFAGLAADGEREECQSLVEQACGELQVHAALEEELFYPAVRECLQEESDAIAEAEVEHQTVKTLIEQLDGMATDDEKYAATFTVLGEYVKHHIKEEENEIFPLLRESQFDWAALGEDMRNRREELIDEFLPEAAGAEGEERAHARSGKARAGGGKHQPHHK